MDPGAAGQTGGSEPTLVGRAGEGTVNRPSPDKSEQNEMSAIGGQLGWYRENPSPLGARGF